MHLVINNLFKTILLPLILATSSISCVSAKPLSIISTILKESKDLSSDQNAEFKFQTTYGSDEICNPKNSSITWSNVESDLAKYGVGMNKINWLFSSDSCTKVNDPKFSYIIIRELRDKNSPSYVYYIHSTKNNNHILVKIHRKSSVQPMSQGRREYFGDVNSFQNGKFILDKFIDSQIDFY